LYDSLLRPQCERLIFIEPNDNINVSVSFNRKTYRPGQAITLTIKTVDKQEQPVKANLSLSVIDAGMVPANSFNIKSYLLLESEIRGKIEEPMSYFDNSVANHRLKLDLLLLTQGWRDYLWRHIEDSTMKIKYQMEQGLPVTGYVRRRFFNKPVPDVNVTMFLPGVKSGALRVVKTDSSGKFDLGSVEFYGNKRIILSSKTSTNRSIGWIFLDSLYTRAIHNPVKVLKLNQLDTSSAFNLFTAEITKKNRILRKYKLSDTIDLNDVRVYENHTRRLKLEKVLKVQPSDTAYYNFDWYMRDKWQYANMPYFRWYNIFGLPGINWRFAARIYNVHDLSMNEINKIEIFRGLGISRDYFYIKVFVKPEAFEKPEYHSMNSLVSGYYTARKFYAPVHRNSNVGAERPDLRTTVFWDPNIVTNEKGEATVKFYNADQTGQVRAVVEGITEKGTIVAGEGKYEVRSIAITNPSQPR
jgi:hypothetical protein